MSLLDITSKVLTVYEAKADDHIDAIKKLNKATKGLHQSELDGAEARKKQYGDWKSQLADTNQMLELAGKAVGFAKEAFHEYADTLRLQAAAGSTNVEGLRKASLGLRTEHELLAFAAKAQHGAYKLTQEQMETAERAMVALTRAGFDQEEVTNKITDALVKGKANGLDDFGIAVKSTGSDVGDFNALMGALADKASGVHEGTRTAAEGVEAVGVSLHDSFDKIKQSIGELVVAMGPLLDALAQAVGVVADVVSWSLKLPGRVVDSITGQAYTKTSGSSKWDEFNKSQGLMIDINAPGGYRKPNVYNPYESYNPFTLDLNYGDAVARNLWESLPEGGFDEATAFTFLNGLKLGKKGGPGQFSDYARSAGTDTAGKPIGFNGQLYSDAAQRARDQSVLRDEYGNPAEAKAYADALKEVNNARLQGEADMAAQRQQLYVHQQSYLEATFGKLEDFHAYSEAFGMLQGATSSAMDAWITGSMSVGDAIKKSIGESLKAMAIQLSIEALKHGAYALGSLAFGDFAGAAAHGVAAAEFGAGAIAAGAAARAMGHGGADYGKSGAGKGASAGGRGKESAGSTGGAGSHDGNGKTVIKEVHTFTYLDPFASQNEQQRREYAQRMVNKAVQESSARR